MGITYRYNAVDNIVETVGKGTLTFNEIVTYLHAVIQDKTIKPGFIELLNLEAIDNFIVEYRQLRPFIVLWQQYLEKGSFGTIIYAPNDVSYGICRMVQTFIDTSPGNQTEDFFVVRTKQERDKELRQLQERNANSDK